MNRILALIILCLVAIVALAQQNVAVKYNVSTRNPDNGELVNREMTLVANNHKSLYFNSMSLYVDSCNSTPEGKARLHEIQMKAWRVVHPDGTVTMDGRKLGLAPEKNEYLYVKKNVANNSLSVFDYKAGGLWRYAEPMGEIAWDIDEDTVQTLLGLDCIMAETYFHGRHWKVWFAPEVPVSDGPWKLYGLPGIILNAVADDGNDFIIEAIEVGTTQQDVPDVYSVDNYERGERKQILSDHEYYINNLESILAAKGIKLNGDGSPANLPKYNRKIQAWETDY